MDTSWICLVFLLLGIRSSESVTNNSVTLSAPTPKTLKISQPVATSRILKVDDYQTGESIRQAVMHRPPSVSMNFQPQWLNDGTNLEGNWFGFNHFIPRSARNMLLGRNQFLGESTITYPTYFHPDPSIYYDDSAAFHHTMNDLQSQGTTRYQDNLVNTRFAAFGQPVRGYLASNERLHQKHQRQHHYPKQQQYHQQPQKRHHNVHSQNYLNFNYHGSNGNFQRPSSSAPMMIKIIPLKLSTIDISNALKSMSWIPIPLNLLKGNSNTNNQNPHKDSSQPVYNDKRNNVFDEDEDESDLPPPSSHVATPPLGITYAEGKRSQHFVRFPTSK